MFDGHTTLETHYVTVFATYPSGTTLGYGYVCLALSPLEDETTQDSDEHIRLSKCLLSVFGKGESNVVLLFGDNCSLNRSITKELDIPLLGCASHRSNLQ